MSPKEFQPVQGVLRPAGDRRADRSAYAYYQSMMGRLYGGGSMMGGGSYGWMMGASGYQWMMGGTAAPDWMRGQALPGFMMSTSSDPGQVMGALFANAPGPRVSPAQAARLGSPDPGRRHAGPRREPDHLHRHQRPAHRPRQPGRRSQ